VEPHFLRFNGGNVGRRIDVRGAEGLRLMGAGSSTSPPTITRPKLLIANDDNGLTGYFAWATVGWHNTTTRRLEIHADVDSQLTGGRHPSVALAARGTVILEVRKEVGGTVQLGFFGNTPVARPAVTGSRGANAALASLLTAFADLGLITDGTGI